MRQRPDRKSEFQTGTFCFCTRSLLDDMSGDPWPFGEFDYVMDDALNIAMDYLIRTDQAINFKETQTTAANAIASAWRAGVRSRMRLTNLAIRAVEQQDLRFRKRG